jgi:uncharacterized protein YceK
LNTSRLIIVISIALLSGCASISETLFSNYENPNGTMKHYVGGEKFETCKSYKKRLFAGTRLDASFIGALFEKNTPGGSRGGDGQGAVVIPPRWIYLGAFVDLPFSVIADTVLTPYVLIYDEYYDGVFRNENGDVCPDDQAMTNSAFDDAVRNGVLRIATDSDFDAWNAFLRETSGKCIEPAKLKGVASTHKSSKLKSFVALKPFTFPNGLYGDNSGIVFIIPKGVPEPTGDKLYSHIYSYNYDYSNWSCKWRWLYPPSN